MLYNAYNGKLELENDNENIFISIRMNSSDKILKDIIMNLYNCPIY